MKKQKGTLFSAFCTGTHGRMVYSPGSKRQEDRSRGSDKNKKRTGREVLRGLLSSVSTASAWGPGRWSTRPAPGPRPSGFPLPARVSLITGWGPEATKWPFNGEKPPGPGAGRGWGGPRWKAAPPAQSLRLSVRVCLGPRPPGRSGATCPPGAEAPRSLLESLEPLIFRAWNCTWVAGAARKLAQPPPPPGGAAHNRSHSPQTR